MDASHFTSLKGRSVSAVFEFGTGLLREIHIAHHQSGWFEELPFTPLIYRRYAEHMADKTITISVLVFALVEAHILNFFVEGQIIGAFEQGADLAPKRGAGNVRFARDGMADDGVVHTTDVQARGSAADVQARDQPNPARNHHFANHLDAVCHAHLPPAAL
jgi:hypothetical protein